MIQELPSSLNLLLETQVEEELYTDWASLLESILLTYCPPRGHLILCFTVLVHPSLTDDRPLQTTCLRIILRVLEIYGPRAFRNVLDFQPVRQQRRRARELASDTQISNKDLDSLGVDLATTESVFNKFSSLWDLIRFTVALRLPGARRWQQLTETILSILKEDWNHSCQSKLDLTKTMLVEQLRDVDDKRVDLSKQVCKPLFGGLLVVAEPRSTPYARFDHLNVENTATSSVGFDEQSVGILLTVCELIILVAQTPKLNILRERDLISVLADNIVYVPLEIMAKILRPIDIISSGKTQNLVLSVCDCLLFRLSAPAHAKNKDGTPITLAKVSEWCQAIASSTAPLEVVWVEYLKYAILEQFVWLNSENLTAAQITQPMKDSLAAIESITQTITNRQTVIASDQSQETKENEDLLTFLGNIDRRVRLLPALLTVQ